MIEPSNYSYAVLPMAEIGARTGRELLQAIIDGKLPQASVSEHLTFWITEVGDGTAAFEGLTGPHLLNPAGTVHGGWALTMIDSACGCAAHSLLPAGIGYTTIETKANFARPILKDTGRVACRAEVVGRGRQIISAEARLTSAEGKILAHGTSTVMVLGARP